jgi:hypothetical protein
LLNSGQQKINISAIQMTILSFPNLVNSIDVAETEISPITALGEVRRSTMTTQTHMAHETSQQTEMLRELRAAMQAHRTYLRLDIDHMEVILRCIARSTDDEMAKYVLDFKESIASLRERLATLQAHWRIFEVKQRILDGV